MSKKRFETPTTVSLGTALSFDLRLPLLPCMSANVLISRPGPPLGWEGVSEIADVSRELGLLVIIDSDRGRRILRIPRNWVTSFAVITELAYRNAVDRQLRLTVLQLYLFCGSCRGHGKLLVIRASKGSVPN